MVVVFCSAFHLPTRPVWRDGSKKEGRGRQVNWEKIAFPARCTRWVTGTVADAVISTTGSLGPSERRLVVGLGLLAGLLGRVAWKLDRLGLACN